MISLSGLFILLSIPIKSLILVLKFYKVGGSSRKYANNLKQSLRLLVFKTAVSLTVFDAYYISFMSNNFVLNKIVPFFHKSITSKLPGYGTRYDKNSIWLVKQPDRKPDDPILIYIHGGGYFLQTQPDQIESVLSIYKLLKPDKQSRLSILLLDYKLASYGYPFPAQINQLHETYLSLVTNEGNTNIILMGDSAGGNLSLGYLQFLKKVQPHNIVYPSKLVLISPWVKLLPELDAMVPGNSFYDNSDRDMIAYSQFDDPKNVYQIIGEGDLDSLQVCPGAKPTKAENWNNIPTLKDPRSDVFVIFGEDESFRDSILDWCQYALDVPFNTQYKYGNSNNQYDKEGYEYIRERDPTLCHLRLYIEPWGLHDSCLFFENHLILKIKEHEGDSKKSSLDANHIDDKEFYGITRIVKFLNETI
ncbi:unnamed protein product [Debaryomyces fabryi]|nr:unnamed protein product [Debaryomyces fabryi]